MKGDAFAAGGFMDVGKRITQLREAQGYTVNKLANLSGISQSHLREIELGNKNPTVETLGYFCDALGVSLEEFFKDESGDISPVLLSSIKKLDHSQQLALAEFLKSVIK